MERELPIQRLIASGSFCKAIRAKGMSRWASLKSDTYSLRKLSFSAKLSMRTFNRGRGERKLTSLRISHFGVLWKGRICLLLDDIVQKLGEGLLLFVGFRDDGGAVGWGKGWRIGIPGSQESEKLGSSSYIVNSFDPVLLLGLTHPAGVTATLTV